MANIIEVAKSGRATCRSCRSAIPKGDLRFGEETPNQFGEPGDLSYRWHHLACAASKLPDEVRAALADFQGEVPGRDALDQTLAAAVANKPPPFPHADRAPTGRATCQGCGEKLAKGALRVVVERDIERGMTVTKGAGYLHPACAAAYVEEHGSTHAELSAGLDANTRGLSEDDRTELFSQV